MSERRPSPIWPVEMARAMAREVLRLWPGAIITVKGR